MFEPNPNYSQYYGFFNHSHVINEDADLVYRAVRLFNAALTRGRFERFKRWITHRSSQLFDLNHLYGIHMRAQYYGGVQAVALKKIRGSLGRTGDFDCDFNPLDSRLRDRWKSIAMACLHNTGLKPVELIQVDDSYYVLDGHHRISVAHALGKCAIDAEVTVWVLPDSLPLAISQPAKPQVQVIQSLL